MIQTERAIMRGLNASASAIAGGSSPISGAQGTPILMKDITRRTSGWALDRAAGCSGSKLRSRVAPDPGEVAEGAQSASDPTMSATSQQIGIIDKKPSYETGPKQTACSPEVEGAGEGRDNRLSNTSVSHLRG